MDTRLVRQKFSELVREPAAEFDLLEGCLLLAAEETPDADLTATRKRLRSLQSRLAEELTGREDFIHAAWALRQILCVEWGMQADPDAAEIPEGLLLTTLLERRQAHPLVFAALYRELARSIGLPVEIVALPGAVVLMFVDGWGRTYIDPVARAQVDNDKEGEMEKVAGVREYIGEFTSNKTWGDEGYLVDKGLIPMSKKERDDWRNKASSLANLVM